MTKEIAEGVFDRIQSDMKVVPEGPKPGSNHSAGVIAVDEDGNVACVLHSINGLLWGSTGIFVDGVSIPDSASFQQQMIAKVGPGMRLPETTNPLIVLKDGKPVLASAAVGSALHQTTLQNLINILDFGMDPKTSVDTPNTQGPYQGANLTGPPKPEYEQETITDGDFSETVLNGVRARGRAIRIVPKSDRSQLGYWIGVQIDPQTHKISASVTSKLPGLVEGY